MEKIFNAKNTFKAVAYVFLMAPLFLKTFPCSAAERRPAESIDGFKGRIVSSNHDPHSLWSGVTGPHFVLYPKSEKDVRLAAKRAREKNWKTFIRSGASLTKDDKVEGADGVVINLETLKDVKIEERFVTVQAGATIEQVFQELAKANCVLPLGDNPHMSIASNLLHEEENPSSLKQNLGSLYDYLQKINAVDSNSVPKHYPREEFNAFKESNSIITSLEFQAESAENLSMICAHFSYPGEEAFFKIVKGLFHSKKPLSASDLVLKTYTGRFGVPLVMVLIIQKLSAEGSLAESLKPILARGVELGVLFGQAGVPIDTNVYSGSEVLNILLEDGTLSSSTDPTITTKKKHTVLSVDEHLDHHLQNYAANVTAFLEGKSSYASRLQLTKASALALTEYTYTPTVPEPAHIAIVTPHLLRPRVEPMRLAFATHALMESPGPIDNFTGPVYQQGDFEYNEKRYQYATTSCDEASMSPLMVAYPVPVQGGVGDIIAAVGYARQHQKKIVARSGGHQYTGKSSGGADTIVLSMDNFNTLRLIGDGKVEVGPGVRLTQLAHQFKKWKITIPHGECPLVAIGGHAQTGGYGHLIRSFGLALDYVHSFDIVLGDGRALTVTRPKPGESIETAEARLNRDLFRGVLGGNAGSFGIVTKYILTGIKDREHPRSYGFSQTRKYNEGVFKKMMRHAQAWTSLIERKDEEGIEGLDFMMTVESSSLYTWLPLMVVELVYTDPKKNVAYAGQFNDIIQTAKEDAGLFDILRSSEGEKRLSALSDSFVRRFPATTGDGREFKYPYTKRVNVTVKALTDNFVDGLSQIITDVVSQESGVKLVFQMAFGGGAFRDKGATMAGDSTITSIPHRQSVYTFVFDLFYSDGNRDKAVRYQERMQAILDDGFHKDSHERRVFWGTFGDTNIKRAAVRKMYYDSEEQYQKLQDLKKRVDPEDIFHTELTVQLPD